MKVQKPIAVFGFFGDSGRCTPLGYTLDFVNLDVPGPGDGEFMLVQIDEHGTPIRSPSGRLVNHDPRAVDRLPLW